MTVAAGLGYLVRGLIDLFAPETCPGCGASEVQPDGLCEACNVSLLELVSQTYCPRCGASLGPNIPVNEGGCAVCPQPLPRFDRVVRLGPYEGPLRRSIREMKFRSVETLTVKCASLLAVALANEESRYDVVLPVPMHWRRRLSRGVDAAWSVARALSRELSVPLGDELIRVRHTPQQAHLSRTARAVNVKGAFAVRSRDGVEGASVLLVDDVTTTGATADEAARTLREAGISHVALAVIAKADPPVAYATQR